MPLILQTGINRQSQIGEAAEYIHALGHGQRPKPPGFGLYRLLLSIVPDGLYHIYSLTDYGQFDNSKAKPKAFPGTFGFGSSGKWICLSQELCLEQQATGFRHLAINRMDPEKMKILA